MKRLQNNKTAEAIYPIRLFNKQAENFEKTRFGWMAILITFQSCLGSVACMFISQSEASVWMLATCAAVTMGSNALFIALAKPKVCLAGFYISVILNTAFLLLNI
ncbi:MAG: hypothetical protein JNL60_01235 [Bacteroidia bacterium]|nr:hypothetical protein [Bacteroidia bacterium]